ncbi:MAG: transcription elongation factor GreB [Bdellovibrionales bacterium]|nr:transcription elongation factor GreB [Bdellovibrionales bacterium]
MTAPNYITPKGFRALQAEFEELFNKERPKVVETVAWAASNGDRSENGDYIYGKKRLREIDRRLRFLTKRIESARVVDPSTIQNNKIVFGATVIVCGEDGVEKCYQIVGEDEIETTLGKISWKSPVAKALMGRSEGDEVVVKRPAGEAYLEILKVEYK